MGFIAYSMAFLDFLFAPMVIMILGVGAIWLAARQFQWAIQPAVGRMELFLWRQFITQQTIWLGLFVLSLVFASRGQSSPLDSNSIMWKDQLLPA